MVAVLVAGRCLVPSSLAAIAGPLVVARLIYERSSSGFSFPATSGGSTGRRRMPATRRRRVPVAA
jgi:hypothetical protein